MKCPICINYTHKINSALLTAKDGDRFANDLAPYTLKDKDTWEAEVICRHKSHSFMVEIKRVYK